MKSHIIDSADVEIPEPPHAKNNNFLSKKEIISRNIGSEIRIFCSFRHYFYIQNNDFEIVKIVISIVCNIGIEEITDEFIEDEFISIKKYLIELGLNK